MTRSITAEQMIADPRLPNTVFTRTPALLLMAQGWTPADVVDLLDDWPDLRKKGARLLDAAVDISGCHSYGASLLPTTADLPVPVTRAWIRLLYNLLDGVPAQSPNVAVFLDDLPESIPPDRTGYVRSQTAYIVSTWTRLIGLPNLAVQIAASGIGYAQAREYQAENNPWTPDRIESLAVLSALLRGSENS